MSADLDLDALLEESESLVKTNKRMKAEQKAANKGKPIERTSNGAVANVGFMNAAERAEHEADVIRFKARAEGWVKLEVVLLTHAQICTHCGAEHHHVQGVFLNKYNAKMRINNLVKPDGAYELAGLPKRVEIRTEQVSMCANCYDVQGWADATKEII